jgi:PAS domain S-box-containing protein
VRAVPALDSLYLDLPVARPGSPVAYLLGAGLVALATALRLAIDPWVTGLQFFVFVPVIIVMTFFCGTGVGSFSATLSVLSAWFFILPPRLSLKLAEPRAAIPLLVFVFLAVTLVAIAGTLRRALTRMRDLAALHAAVFESNPDAMLVTSGEGRILRVNERTVRLFGYPRSALLGSPIEMLVPDRLRTRHVAHRGTFARAPQPREMGTGLPLFGRRADGSEFPVDVQIGPVADGVAAGIIANVRDITEQKAAAEALADSRRDQGIATERRRGAEALQRTDERLAKIVAAAPMAIHAIDAANTITMWNPAAERIYGIAAAAVIGREWPERGAAGVPPDTLSPEELVAMALADGGFENIEIRRLTPEGVLRELSISAALLRDSAGAAAGIVFVAHDVGATKEIERRLRGAQKLEAIGQLTGGVAHDFNNLLAIIQGNLELLLDRDDADPETLELAGDALKASRRGASLTHRLLAYSRQQQLAPRVVDPAEMLAGMVDVPRRVIEKSIDIVTRLAPDLWRTRIDTQQFENVLISLAVNARDAMPDGGTLTFAAENAVLDRDYCGQYPDLAAGDYVLISVTDTGTGMTREVLDRALEPFFTTKPVGEGTGLGLSMVYGFVKQSGGHLTIFSEPGYGTTVKLYLPKFEPEPGAEPVGERASRAAEGEARVVLVVEDDPSVRRLQRRVLDALGYRTLEAADGPAALEILRGGAPVDLLLSDIVLPGGLSGPALAEAARRDRPGLKIIFMSGYAPDTITRLHDLSGITTLSKPFTRAVLAEAVRRTLEDRE